jgi:hypothetical protein
MRYLILFCVCFLIAQPAQAQNTKTAPPTVRAFLEFCLPPIAAKEDPADFALRAKLLEFAPDQAQKFAPQGGRVFAIPYAKGKVVLMTSSHYAGMCSIAIRKTDKVAFITALDTWFGAKTPFKLIREKRMDDERITRREYTGDINGPVTFLVSLSDVPRENGMQALMTLARVVETP